MPVRLAPSVALWLALAVVGAPGQVSWPGFLSSPLQTVAAGGAAPDEPFTILFVADPEPRMRGNSDEEVAAYVENLASYKTTRVEYFDHGGGALHRVDPLLVVLGGDISADRDTSIEKDWGIWRRLEANGVAVIAGFGNHDWEPQSGYSLDGDTSNRAVVELCRAAYRNASQILAPRFGYQEVGPSERGPVHFVAELRGVQIVNLNSFLYQPSYRYDFASSQGQLCLVSKARRDL